jgi:hypothetical protein
MARAVFMKALSKWSRVAAALATLLANGACSDVGPRVFTAVPYDAEGSCLGEYESIGLVEADSLSASCEPVCLELAGTVYVSTLCAPYPDVTTVLTAAESEECAAALSAEACE